MADISTDDISKLSTWINGTIGMRQDFPLEDGHFIQSCWELHSELVCVFASELLLFTHVHLDFKTSTELLPYIYKPTHHYPCCVVISVYETYFRFCLLRHEQNRMIPCELTVSSDLPGFILASVLSFPYLV